MKISHYITLDTGSGPASFVEIGQGDEIAMIRVRHKARYERAAKVDAAGVRTMIERMPNLGVASGTVPPEHMATLEAEVLRWMTAEMSGSAVPQALRWLDDGSALTFRTDAEVREYDNANRSEDDGRPKPVRQRRAMMG